MGIAAILFWILSVLTIFSAIMVVVSKNPVHSVLWLIATFFAISGHYIMMNAQFLAIVNIIVYAGAIMVLFLFVIMLMNLNSNTEPRKNIWAKLIGVISAGMLLWILISVVRTFSDQIKGHPQIATFNTGNIGLIKNLGQVLFTQYALPFEITSVLFLSAMIGAVVIGKKN
ncbi:MAG TPA: NADH-quinone oxidoreductase subunit J [Arachidicoccus soli]|uniref:NADH-quinone oxidoreductase subunit J n=1 Tax=Arachidicoccus soli TaxID=2341117 RepID=A0A386HJV5_9BACT|nr:NADH-quinone oxidoreductase subunit J [Arachidicoccus soli]AYD46148.1 NADH-quinone oxidoreductase subunit J [Arachidicoccus soli]HEU0227514.1 NADH-quinone oxidoreductase subunit J [Arachidicoccus soli]